MLCGDVTKHPHDGLEVRVRRPNGANAIRLPLGESHDTCAPCAALRWMQVVAAFDSGGRAAVIRLIKADEPVRGSHLRRSPPPHPGPGTALPIDPQERKPLCHTAIRRIDPPR